MNANIRPSDPPACRHCGGRGFLSGSTHYVGLGDSPVTYCRSCALGRELERQWAAEPAQSEYARRFRKARAMRALELSNLGAEFAGLRLSSLNGEPAVRAACRGYVRGWPELRTQGRGLYFHGPVGSGKTHAAAVVANELIETHLTEVLFLNVPELAGRLRESLRDEGQDADAALLVGRMRSVELLVLDDLGVERPSTWIGEILYRVIDERWRERRPLLVASPYPPAALGRRYSPQLASRLLGRARSVRVTGRDRRGRPPI